MSEEKNYYKQRLIIQSFLPLYVMLLIKYFDPNILYLLSYFSGKNNPFVMPHLNFYALFLETFNLIMIIISFLSISEMRFKNTANFNSEGKALKEIKALSTAPITFFMTFILPLLIDDFANPKGILIFAILVWMIYVLMCKTNLYYQNPVLLIFGYKVFSYRYESGNDENEYIGISKENIVEQKSIKTQSISDDVYFIAME